jgi:2-dehydro-3-deoxyglucarate aldolase/4-hydroxy-2-oxoheptanedioate aldolase
VHNSPVFQAIDERGVAVGVMLYEFDTRRILRILEAAGVDFAIFDLEHTGWDAGTLRTVLASGGGTSVYSITRVARTEYELITAALDAGSDGVMAPMVETREQAEFLVECAKYPPAGRRGFGVLMADELAEGPQAETERANRENLVIAQIESATGVEHAEAIVSVPGVDMIWMGQFDLSLSLGVPGQFDHREFRDAVDHLVGVCRDHQKPLGQMITSQADGRAQRARGFDVLAYCDIWMFENSLRDQLNALRPAR